MGSISHNITPVVINSLGGGDTHQHTCMPTFTDKAVLSNQACTGVQPVCAWFKLNERSITNMIAFVTWPPFILNNANAKGGQMTKLIVMVRTDYSYIVKVQEF